MGHQIIPGTTLEILGVRWDAVVARDAVCRAGRPGIHISDVSMPLTCRGKMAAVDQEYGFACQMSSWFRRWSSLRQIMISSHG